MTKYLILIFTFVALQSMAQLRMEAGGNIGLCNYMGDVGGNSEYRIPLKKGVGEFYKTYIKWYNPNFTVSGYFRYKIIKRITSNSQISFYRLKSSDVGSENLYKIARNLSFRTSVFEVNQQFEFNFYLRTKVSKNSPIRNGSRKQIDVRGFFFTGLGFSMFSPKAKFNGEYVKLRPLKTEGNKYSPITWSVPFGVGINYVINKKYSLGCSFSYHFTGSDYLDDVSKFYAVDYKDAADKKNASKPEFVLANRTPEVQSYDFTGKNYNINLPEGREFDINSERGAANNKDGYYSATVSFGMVLKGKNKFYRKKSKQLKNVRKVQTKKYRAKF